MFAHHTRILIVTGFCAAAFGSAAMAYDGVYRDVAPAAGNYSPPGRTMLAPERPMPDMLPDVQQFGDVIFITGGIGDEERAAIEAVKPHYNLHLMSAKTTGTFSGDTDLAIYDMQGRETLMTTMGPLLYAKIPPGTYRVEAANEGQMKKQTITVGRNSPAHIHFSWK